MGVAELIATEESDWYSMSLQGALAGMEEDVFPEYQENNLIESA